MTDRQLDSAPGGRASTRTLARFGTVLLLQFGLLCWLVTFGHGRDSRVLMDLTGVVIPMFAIAVMAEGGWRRRLFIVIALLDVGFSGGGLSGFRFTALEIGPALSALFSAYATWVILRRVVRTRQVTGDVFAGALAAYIMAGLAFAVVFGVIVNRIPDAFSVPGGGVANFPDLVYFSFVTLLTIGFGDVAPVAPVAKTVVLVEGLFGVVYTTIVMASLVAVYLHQRDQDDRT